MGNDLNEVEDVLAHFGVKGMKWGVRKERNSYSTASARSQKKELRETRKAKNSAALKKAGDAEKRAEDVFEGIKRENKKKGMSTMAADRAAFKDPRYQKAASKAAKEDDKYISEAKKNRAEYKQAVKDIRVEKMDWNKKTAGEKAVSYMFQPAAKTRIQRIEAKNARRQG